MKAIYCLTAACLLSLLSPQRSFAVEELKVGDPAPEFGAQADDGSEWKSADHVGKKILVVYFYPADLTGGCTKQACKFRDDMSSLTKLGVEVVGVSGDTVENHQVFKKAHDLNYPLLADVKGEVATAFGVPVTLGEKSVTVNVDGKELNLIRFATAKRWTFVIDEDGKIAYKNENVNPELDSHEVAEVVKGLKKAK
ncbi:peroxiredoxin [Planctomicrobium sp. SH661]|uniref:peroxiredoxin n=1 Tax=Planctomicrobium sp. SH661 TaxID=3448124 RepID=UPI003F5BE5B8